VTTEPPLLAGAAHDNRTAPEPTPEAGATAAFNPAGGAGATHATVMFTVAAAEVAVPSDTAYVNESGPQYLSAGV
jgi:hypothetical protein